jgi:pyruvate formate lyase activating enzyme
LLATLGVPLASSCTPASPTSEPSPAAGTPTPVELREAMHYQRLDDGRVNCQICFRQCVVSDGQLGFCANRKNVKGTFYSLIHGRPCALQVDPIEKEPVFHMLPGHTIFCVGTASCNSRCKFCQNWEMSQRTMWETVNYRVTPAEVIEHAESWGCTAVSFTYNEPTVFYEYMYDIACLAREHDLRVVCHTNGTMLAAPMTQLLEQLDAITVDLKGFSKGFYHRVCTLELEPVLASLQRIASSGVHLEIVNLVIPTLNDELEDVRNMCTWIAENLGVEVPVHFTRFFPAYKMQYLPPTPIETLEAAVAIGDEVGLHYVYLGNAPGHKRNSTFCPECGERIIHRLHFAVAQLDVVEGNCRFCGHPIAGIWEN